MPPELRSARGRVVAEVIASLLMLIHAPHGLHLLELCTRIGSLELRVGLMVKRIRGGCSSQGMNPRLIEKLPDIAFSGP
jgi:hypothetical protein